MQDTSEIQIGQVVRSKAGRDKGKVFVVVKIVDDRYVMLVDGDIRKLDHPKKKKIIHLVIYKTILEELRTKMIEGIKFNNAYVRKMLEPFNKEL